MTIRILREAGERQQNRMRDIGREGKILAHDLMGFAARLPGGRPRRRKTRAWRPAIGRSEVQASGQIGDARLNRLFLKRIDGVFPVSSPLGKDISVHRMIV